MSSAPKACSVSVDARVMSAFLVTSQRKRDGIVADGAGGGFRGIEIDVGERDARAFARISLGDAFADAGAGTGDECGLAIETHGFNSPVQIRFGTTP